MSNAIYRKFSSNFDIRLDPEEAMGEGRTYGTNYGPEGVAPEEREAYEKRYHKKTAGLILSQLRNNKNLALSIFLRKYRNLEYVFKHELEPLFYEEVK